LSNRISRFLPTASTLVIAAPTIRPTWGPPARARAEARPLPARAYRGHPVQVHRRSEQGLEPLPNLNAIHASGREELERVASLKNDTDERASQVSWVALRILTPVLIRPRSVKAERFVLALLPPQPVMVKR
jgi:hypothetical protein